MISLVRDPTSVSYSPKTKLLLLTPPPIDLLAGSVRTAERTRSYAEAVKAVGKEASVPVVDTWTDIMNATRKREGELGEYFTDGLHLSEKGYRVVFEGEFNFPLDYCLS